jgi:hypothetical protein
MAKIYIPACNEYRDITQIVAFGCSMTAGAELIKAELRDRAPNYN